MMFDLFRLFSFTPGRGHGSPLRDLASRMSSLPFVNNDVPIWVKLHDGTEMNCIADQVDIDEGWIRVKFPNEDGYEYLQETTIARMKIKV